MLKMANHPLPIRPVSPQDHSAITASECGDAIVQMKRLARCETDAELAAFLGKGKTAVAQWRRRRLVPEGAILRLLNLVEGKNFA
ncbi:hypothetical protein M9979_13920 [Sphingomonas sp. RP10(2022)]|uniref:Uncharacterized protein n=1 Tax=Sphingomonas liriopis TaxID=2949094 RepID=A0A9X2HXB6_9SPHN|nr:hypothetical protein [Sphingomonas liriopis]MCP3735966.1 hypothetical protein [Sphingomonas liriopis]